MRTRNVTGRTRVPYEKTINMDSASVKFTGVMPAHLEGTTTAIAVKWRI